jgi:CRP/FNR family cyclic AMP-dependent transcriptional regulator
MMETNLLISLPHFSGMSPEEAAVVAGVMRENQWADGAKIIEQGDKGGGVYFLMEGDIRIDRQQREGEIVTVGRIGQGAVFGVLGVLDGLPRAASCIAQGEVRCAVMERGEFMDLMDGSTPLAMRFQISILRYLARDVRSTNRRLAELAAVPACAVEAGDLEEVFPELSS